MNGQAFHLTQTKPTCILGQRNGGILCSRLILAKSFTLMKLPKHFGVYHWKRWSGSIRHLGMCLQGNTKPKSWKRPRNTKAQRKMGKQDEFARSFRIHPVIGTEEKKGEIVMVEYSEILKRRIDQFSGYLKKMYHRGHNEVGGPCFLIFKERWPNNTNGHDELTAAVKPSLELVLHGFEVAAKDSLTMDSFLSFPDLPEEGWREDNSQSRFIQFSFEEKWFCMDMPLQTLFLPEAEQILRSLKGFFFLRDRPEFTLFGEDVEGYDPFRKIYLYGDEQTAAEEMAFIFFHVWKFPVDWRFFVKAAAFSGKETNWEWGTPIE